MKSILVISSEQTVFDAIHSCLHSEYRIQYAETKKIGLEVLGEKPFDLIFVDLILLRGGGNRNGYKEWLRPFLQLHPTIEIIVMSSQEMIREAVMAVKAGASNYLTYPVNAEQVKYVTEDIHEYIIVQSELDYLRDRFWQSDSFEVLHTEYPRMEAVFDKIKSVAPTRSTVLFVGETGTGKGVMARLVHRLSNRKDEQFISVHCGAIPDTLLESELFGHEKGAFTGAVRRKLGKFEIARGGTIFLDEIGTITPSAQIKLLQVLQDGTFQRVGCDDTTKSNVRVISATNMDLKKMCDDGQFRRDLYYRLNVFPIELPPLRERIDDIPSFAEASLKKLNKFLQKGIHHIHPKVMDAFRAYEWPGNIREFENLMERAYILESSSVLTPGGFPTELFEPESRSPNLSFDAGLNLSEVRQRAVDYVEEKYLKELLGNNKGRINETALAAGITTRHLHKLMKKYKLRKEEFKG
ncbi:MAG: sigma-54 dependent transcriptional regulator [Deltaproteobacteria bacterium]|nr:sigma-54 dependent transcriptional regulator [Deltaproteobacteria bacterium]